ncbi:hypothetical protein SAMN02745664_12434 [Moraxella cuniculi DSM 21768]|uniref:Phage tail tube protein, TTP n=1 Tax=Moraxella cuniculi DSM 21768 TaxID=1122245 RepID=A0A1N7G764_9GAMM|nr:hypothetical protein [Moraxella cuniculi]OOS04372.1 hypothetical protein B0189_08675 [Moraxella cuniculi]SIS08412.1 hypothetical protein SAMN02745664_12434 [Moraxella cuniculi DSM 21768]
MAKNVANLKDSFYQLLVSTDGSQFKKIEHLQKAGVPSEEKVMDEVTSTDDNRTIKAPINFFEEGEVEFEIVLDPQDTVHQSLQTAFDAGTELHWRLTFTHAPAESRQFTGIISKYTTDNEDTKKKLRKQGTISITGAVTKVEPSSS